MDVRSDILSMETFEVALEKNQHQVYLQASNELLGGVGHSAEYYAANPLALLDVNLAFISPPNLNCLLRVSLPHPTLKLISDSAYAIGGGRADIS